MFNVRNVLVTMYRQCKDEGEDSGEEINGCGCCVVVGEECEQKSIVIKY